MIWAHGLVFGSLVCSLLAYIVAAKALFKPNQENWHSYLFFALFLVFSGVTVYASYQTPTQSILRLVVAQILCMQSAVLFFWAAKTIYQRPFTVIFSPDEPHQINTDGPYTYVRHPFYTSYISLFGGFSLYAEQPVVFFNFTVLLIIYIVSAWSEEKKFSRSPLAHQYAAYASRTGMFLPRLF